MLGTRVLRVVMASAAVATLGAGALNVLNLFFVEDNLHAEARWLGTLGMGEGLGAVAGALVAGRLCRRFGDVRVFSWGLALAGVGLLCYARVGTLWAAVVALACVGVPPGTVNAALSPTVLRVTPPGRLGRTAAILGPVNHLASLVSALGAGWLVGTVLHDVHHTVLGVEFGPIDTVYVFSGAAVLLAGLHAMGALRAARAAQAPAPARSAAG